ncbi:ComF family protein [Candidatus Parcubacteria bacterium]|nr:ComF family protein [Candidatus Parcubacteria bacterium]
MVFGNNLKTMAYKSLIIKLKNHTKILCDFLTDILFPITCIECNKKNVWFCDSCFNKLKLNLNQKCLICNRKSEYGKICKSHKKYLTGVLIASEYKNKTLRNIIKTFKYNFITDLRYPLSKFLSIFLLHQIRKTEIDNTSPLNFLLEKDTIFIPIPLHKKRLRWRQFNQAELLLNMFTNHLPINTNTENLIRIKYQKPQAKLKKHKRQQNIKNSFLWNGENLKDKTIILIDDVVTSGSTLEECAKILKNNNAKKIWGLVLAKG